MQFMTLNYEEKILKNLSQERIDAILAVSDIAEKEGINIYLIGGIVRDIIMNNSISDIDIAIEADAIKFSEILNRYIKCKIINIQDKLKTVKVKFTNSVEIDIASTREELYKESGILPQGYNFGCEIEKDIKRRDFTINTLAIKLTGKDRYSLIDYYGGYSDIKNKQIKILHKNSFIDDPSRIIRALKFSSRFNFEIEKWTYNTMQEYLNNVNNNMPLERVKNELKQYFAIKKANIYKKLIDTNAYKLISDKPIKKIYTKRLKELEEYKIIEEENLWYIYFIALIINSDYLNEKLNLNNQEKRILKETKELLEKNTYKNAEEIYRGFIKKNNISISCYYMISKDKEDADKYLNELKEIKLEITGEDIKELGVNPSKYYKEIMEEILREKINKKINNKKEEIEYAKKIIKKQS